MAVNSLQGRPRNFIYIKNARLLMCFILILACEI